MNVQDSGAVKDPDAAPGYTMATTQAYYTPPSGLPPPEFEPSHYAHDASVAHGPSMSVSGEGKHYNVYGQ